MIKAVIIGIANAYGAALIGQGNGVGWFLVVFTSLYLAWVLAERDFYKQDNNK